MERKWLGYGTRRSNSGHVHMLICSTYYVNLNLGQAVEGVLLDVDDAGEEQDGVKSKMKREVLSRR